MNKNETNSSANYAKKCDEEKQKKKKHGDAVSRKIRIFMGKMY